MCPWHPARTTLVVRILVTGGTGVLGGSAISELLRRHHRVRLLSRRADRHAARWPDVEAFNGDIRERTSIAGACVGCDAVVHLAGITGEHPPGRTFAAVNVNGTRNVVEEAAASRVVRFIYISSVGAERASSDYHRSKRDAEAIVRASAVPWTIVRTASVYGPGDDAISQLVKMMRALPAVPLIARGDHPLQPVWHEDVAAALAIVIERDDLVARILEVAGAETTTMDDVLERLAEITERNPIRVPLPKLHLVREDDGVAAENALVSVLGIRPTPLQDGLRRLAQEMPEQLPEEGIGALEHKRFFAQIRGSRMRSAGVMSAFLKDFSDIIPLDFEPEPHASTAIVRGNTLTMKLPLRGNAQVRIEVVEPQRLVLATIEGHPLAGAVMFSTSDRPTDVEFAIDTYTRSANLLDWIATKTIGAMMQDANWKRVVQKVVDLSGGDAPQGVQSIARKLSDEEAHKVERSLRAAIQSRQRKESAEDIAQR